jgi:hypothetical protein
LRQVGKERTDSPDTVRVRSAVPALYLIDPLASKSSTTIVSRFSSSSLTTAKKRGVSVLSVGTTQLGVSIPARHIDRGQHFDRVALSRHPFQKIKFALFK